MIQVVLQERGRVDVLDRVQVLVRTVRQAHTILVAFDVEVAPAQDGAVTGDLDLGMQAGPLAANVPGAEVQDLARLDRAVPDQDTARLMLVDHGRSHTVGGFRLGGVCCCFGGVASGCAGNGSSGF